jgi:hypothetical protein
MLDSGMMAVTPVNNIVRHQTPETQPSVARPTFIKEDHDAGIDSEVDDELEEFKALEKALAD